MLKATTPVDHLHGNEILIRLEKDSELNSVEFISQKKKLPQIRIEDNIKNLPSILMS